MAKPSDDSSDGNSHERAPRDSFYRLPQFRVASLLGWMLLVAGFAGWMKYHRDLQAEELSAIQALAEANCGVDAVWSFRERDFDGRYGERFWYEPPFLQRVRELKISGDAPADLLVRAASLPAVTKFEVEDFTWPARELPPAEILGQSPPQLPVETLTENDFVQDDDAGELLHGDEYARVLNAVLESRARERSIPERLLLHAFESTTVVDASGRYDDRMRTLAAHDGERILIQDQGTGPLYLDDGEGEIILRTDVEDAWSVLRKAPDSGQPTSQFSYAFLRLMPSAMNFAGANRFGWSMSWSDDDDVTTVRRLADDVFRVDMMRTRRSDDEAGVFLMRETESTVVSEASEWLPIAQRLMRTFEGDSTRDPSRQDEAFRYLSFGDRTLLAESFARHEGEEGYRRVSRIRCAYDLAPKFDETTFDAKRLVGPNLAEPSTYPFRWYLVPLFAGIAFVGVRLIMRIGGRFTTR